MTSIIFLLAGLALGIAIVGAWFWWQVWRWTHGPRK